MKKNFNEKQQRFSFRKLSVGLVSATVASLFFMTSIATAQGVGAQSIQLTYVTEQELTDHEKNAIVYDVPGKVEKRMPPIIWYIDLLCHRQFGKQRTIRQLHRTFLKLTSLLLLH